MLEVTKISKKAGNFALKDVSFDVPDRAYFVILGMSGAGKTMLLEIIAGLRKPDSGSVFFNGEDITRLKANKRGVGLVFQDNAIFPHMSVEKNIAYACYGRGFTKNEIRGRVLKWAEAMNIKDLLCRKPSGLSGGELRRVALARTLAMEPSVLLLDEPLSSLDVLIQYDMIRLLKKLKESGQTIIHVTHDYYEAYALADLLTIINSGSIEQTGPPAEVFRNPASRFVCALTGIRNFFTGIEISKAGELYRHKLPEDFEIYSSYQCATGTPVFIREEDVKILPSANFSGLNIFEGRVTDIIPSPDFFSVVVDAGVNFFARVPEEDMPGINIHTGNTVKIKISPEAVMPVGR
ncbi:MAG TPA: ABC transporter ATP-binding protein [Bacteroidales bacterium]|nr:ABC transporter ATP-binding protein [Bacteroidales bacterium]